MQMWRYETHFFPHCYLWVSLSIPKDAKKILSKTDRNSVDSRCVHCKESIGVSIWKITPMLLSLRWQQNIICCKKNEIIFLDCSHKKVDMKTFSISKCFLAQPNCVLENECRWLQHLPNICLRYSSIFNKVNWLVGNNFYEQ